MIYQCFHTFADMGNLFESGPYQECDLSVIWDDPVRRAQLGEYAAMQSVYRHLPAKITDGSWVGFTSVNQLAKQPHVFKDAAEVEKQLAIAPILCWGWTSFVEMGTLQPVSLLEQGEIAYPGLTGALIDILWRAGTKLPLYYSGKNAGPLHNYWAMTAEVFRRYMGWSLPLVDAALAELGTDTVMGRYLATSPRALTHLHRRLFICWLSLTGINCRHIGQIRTVPMTNRHLPEKEVAKAVPGIVVNLGEGCGA